MSAECQAAVTLGVPAHQADQEGRVDLDDPEANVMQQWSRRRFLVAAAAATMGVAGGGCGIASRSRPVGPAAKEVAAAEARRRRPGAPVREVTLTATAATIDLAGRAVPAWAYNHTVPGPVLRVRAGEVLRVRLDNHLPEPTSIHWHGIVIRNDMDGVPGVTQPPVAANSRFVYEFTVPDAGTYFFHPHVGLQLDHGLYAALVVEDPAEAGGYDQEAVVVLDDWTLGVGPTPEQHMRRLMAQGGMMGGGRGMGMLGGRVGVARRWAGLAARSTTRCTCSTGARRPTRRRSAPGRGSGCGYGSSTPPPRPPSGSRSAATGSP